MVMRLGFFDCCFVLVGLVFLGGCLGIFICFVIVYVWLFWVDGVLWGMLVINFVGVFVLVILFELFVYVGFG